jgi:hypothetical protein
MHRRQLFRTGRGDELIYAHAIGFSEALDFCFDRERQPNQMSTLRILSHLIPRKATAGVSTSMPNCVGIAFSLGERAIRSSRAAQNYAVWFKTVSPSPLDRASL